MAKIAICGYGTVGSGVAEVIAENADSIARNAAEDVSVKYILDNVEFILDNVENNLHLHQNKNTLPSYIKPLPELGPGHQGYHRYIRYRYSGAQ